MGHDAGHGAMPKKAKELSAIEVRRLAEPGRHPVGGVDGLLLRVMPTGSRQWCLRVATGTTRTGKNGNPFAVRRDIGLGGYPDVTLAQARAKAREIKNKLLQGVDPVEERKLARAAKALAQVRGLTFEEAAKRCHAVKDQEFKNHRHSQQWYATLDKYVIPTLGRMPVAAIDTPDVLAVLEPIWAEIPETAGRVRQRMAAVFDWSRAANVRTAPNPAAWKDCLEALLPKTEKVKRSSGKTRRHHAALPVYDVPRLMADLATREAIGAKALRFAILTVARSSEVRLATWDEFDLEARVWRLSADRTKAGKAHSVPLSDAAVALLQSLPSDNNLVFPSGKGVELSDMTLSKLLKDAHAADVAKGGAGYLDPTQDRVATPHGTARSSFKDWSRENNRFPDEWSELALAHVNSDQTRAAYARGELLEERRAMMEAWGQFCEPVGCAGHMVAPAE